MAIMVSSTNKPSITRLSTTYPRAHKPYSCMICGLPIPLFERHTKITWHDPTALNGPPIRTARIHTKCPDEVDHDCGIHTYEMGSDHGID